MAKSIVAGKITGAFGIKGWVKIHSHTDPEDALFSYPSMKLFLNGQQVPLTLDKYQQHGKGFVAKFTEVTDRNHAEALKGGLLQVEREEFGELEDGEYYWDDLLGLEVINTRGITLGQVDYLFNAGASDVMVVKGDTNDEASGSAIKSYMIPFIMDQFIMEVDLSSKKIVVDWDENF